MAKSGTKFSGMPIAGKSPSRSQSAATSAGSSRHGARRVKKDGNSTIVSRDDRRRGKTDWAAVDALTDEEIAEAVTEAMAAAEDPIGEEDDEEDEWVN